MKVFVVFDQPSVRVSGDDDAVVLDLMAHFVGLVEPDNCNGAPTAVLPCAIAGRTKTTTALILPFREPQSAEQKTSDRRAFIEAAYERALSHVACRMRFVGGLNMQVLREFEDFLCDRAGS